MRVLRREQLALLAAMLGVAPGGWRAVEAKTCSMAQSAEGLRASQAFVACADVAYLDLMNLVLSDLDDLEKAADCAEKVLETEAGEDLEKEAEDVEKCLDSVADDTNSDFLSRAIYDIRMEEDELCYCSPALARDAPDCGDWSDWQYLGEAIMSICSSGRAGGAGGSSSTSSMMSGAGGSMMAGTGGQGMMGYDGDTMLPRPPSSSNTRKKSPVPSAFYGGDDSYPSTSTSQPKSSPSSSSSSFPSAAGSHTWMLAAGVLLVGGFVGAFVVRQKKQANEFNRAYQQYTQAPTQSEGEAEDAMHRGVEWRSLMHPLTQDGQEK
jgi:hypothetical protein